MTQTDYVAGVCNIGQEEVVRRKNMGWVAFAVTLVLLAALVWAGVNPWWRLLVFFPATLSASGFLQAYFHFCSGFARKGIFNFGSLGQTSTVTDKPSKIKDKSRGNTILLYSVLIGAAMAIISMLV